jgi:hypothetical protein
MIAEEEAKKWGVLKVHIRVAFGQAKKRQG